MRTLVLLAWAPLLLSACTYECNAANCADGCCGENGVCYVGGSDRYCGEGAVACQDCSAKQQSCKAGRCETPCVKGAPCQTRADCCSAYICVNQACTTCLLSEAVCTDKGDCCAPNKCVPAVVDYRCR